jgi:chemotaxis protein methyltransferase CheR
MPYPGPSPRLSEICYQRFSDLVRARSGIELPAVRRPDLEKAVMKTMDELGLASPEALLDYLTAAGHDGVALEGVVSRITVGETHFFRNQPQFAALEEHILPQLIEARRGVRRLRIWSAGCATGEEPYSLAIALQHCLPDLANWNVLILATDINRSALANAQKGVYGAWSFRETSPQFQAEYFDAVERKFVIKPSLRAMVTFAYLNLVEDRYPSMFTNTQAMDLIFCRNVLIYFSEATNRGVVERLGQCLTPGGWLVVGHAEPSQLMFRSFTVHNFPGTILYQKPGDGVAGFPSPPSTREKVTRRRLPDVGPTFAAPPARPARRPRGWRGLRRAPPSHRRQWSSR